MRLANVLVHVGGLTDFSRPQPGLETVCIYPGAHAKGNTPARVHGLSAFDEGTPYMVC